MNLRHTILTLSVASLGFACGGAPDASTDSQFESAALQSIPVGTVQLGPQPTSCLGDATAKIQAKAAAAAASLGQSMSTIFAINNTPCAMYLERFQYGGVYYSTASGIAVAVHGDIYHKYLYLNEAQSPLGYPTTDEIGSADGNRYTRFEHGLILWKPSLGAHALWGTILDTWGANDYKSSPPLGYPTTDIFTVTGEKGSRDQMASFENGVVYKLASHDTAEVLDALGSLVQDPDTVKNGIKDALNTQLGSSGYVESVDPVQVSDYTHDADKAFTVHNRHFTVTTHNHYFVSTQVSTPLGPVTVTLPDAWGTITLELEIFFNRPLNEIDYNLIHWSANTTDSAPGVSNLVQDEISKALDKLTGPQHLKPLGGLGVVAQDAKPMADGSLNLYVSPYP